MTIWLTGCWPEQRRATGWFRQKWISDRAGDFAILELPLFFSILFLEGKGTKWINCILWFSLFKTFTQYCSRWKPSRRSLNMLPNLGESARDMVWFCRASQMNIAVLVVHFLKRDCDQIIECVLPDSQGSNAYGLILVWDNQNTVAH